MKRNMEPLTAANDIDASMPALVDPPSPATAPGGLTDFDEDSSSVTQKSWSDAAEEVPQQQVEAGDHERAHENSTSAVPVVGEAKTSDKPDENQVVNVAKIVGVRVTGGSDVFLDEGDNPRPAASEPGLEDECPSGGVLGTDPEQLTTTSPPQPQATISVPFDTETDDLLIIAAPAVGMLSATPTPAAKGTTAGTSGRLICLRALRGNEVATAGTAGSGGGGGGGAAASAGGQEEEKYGTAGPAADQAGAVIVGTGGGGVVVGVPAKKIVDLREVKKVRPGPLEPAEAALTDSGGDGGNEEEETLEGRGLVKVDLSAGKRMIEFQLKVNAAEEKREAARVKNERERAGEPFRTLCR